MAQRRIRPDVLRPFLLVLAIIIALFVLQFWRPVPPDIRQQQQRSVYETDLRVLYTALQEYQRQFNTLPANWADLSRTNFPFETIKLPAHQPDHVNVVQTPAGPEVQDMPFRLLQQGRVDFGGAPQPLIQLRGSEQIDPAVLYTNGTIQWGKTEP